ncbi:hypothetical protein [Streptococcus pneumoniae]|uniref:hypothetical protein n=1 Tax=Streptococcus pneumoniae TaxID=1313 RepID=UPI0010244CD3|nr:hypothetical protein [Streptococcus pneumoniae]VFI20365.1 Group II intron maturase [Streptococcus pneumoniae]VQW43468.1 Group II intron maturase [Streptococcus pneumoniae]
MSKLLDKILSRENMLEAYNQVKSNKGSAGIDGMTRLVRNLVHFIIDDGTN